MDEQTKEPGVQLVAVDSFHTSQTGTVPARAPFETHRAHADDLIKRGLASEAGEKKAEPVENKMAPGPDNKKASKPESKAKK